MKILVTAFEPFNGRDINPSQLILEKIEAPEGVTLIKELLPVEFKATTKILKELLKQHQPDVVISLGQAGNRPEISVERVAINLDNCRSSNGEKTIKRTSTRCGDFVGTGGKSTRNKCRACCN